MEKNDTIYPDIIMIEGKGAIGKLVTNNVKETVFTPKGGKTFSYMVYLPPNSIKEKLLDDLIGKIANVWDGDRNTLAVREIVEYREEVLGDVIYME
mgnify:FL=1|jgi:hypothetical protein